MRYFPHKIEKKWQKIWLKMEIYEPDIKKTKKPFYNLMMFPYPSAEGLHVGNMYAFTGADIYGRFMRMRGRDVFEPIGLDGFGIHSENFAMKIGRHPADQAKISEKNFYRQLEALGNGFAWCERLETYNPEYYKWTQWIFVQMFKRGLAYRKKQAVNWCPNCKTVLADEQVIQKSEIRNPKSETNSKFEIPAGGEARSGRQNSKQKITIGVCERCDTPVIKKELEQWFFKITDYAERLLGNLAKLDWSERVKIAQKNWIGKSEGALIKFPISNFQFPIKDLDFVFIHGYKGDSRDIFWPWFRKEIERRGAKVFAPDLPNSDAPNINEQVQYVLKQHSFSEKTVIVTHSLGGVVAMKLLPLLHDKIERLLLVAPPLRTEFLDGKKRPALEDACDWKFNFNEIKKHARNISVLADTEDHVVSLDQLVEIAGQLNARLRKTVASAPHFREIVEPEIVNELFPEIEIFTTRPDTLFGATYLVLSPEYEEISNFQFPISNRGEVDEYIKNTKAKTEEERISEGREKTGVELKGIKVINPVNGEEIPVWVADYVLGGVGMGAIMAVPAHDERDFEFAKKHDLPIKTVVESFYIQKEEPGVYRENESIVPRDGIITIIKHWSEDKYIGLKWKKVAWGTFLTGGIEKGQTAEQAGVAEILEETGYLHPKFIRELGITHGLFYHVPKKENRLVHAHILYFELQDGARTEISEKEQEIHDIKWLTLKELKSFLTPATHTYALDLFREGIKVYTGGGILCNSGEFNGMDSEKAKLEITKFVCGERKIQYRLRDWLISRQRYWGPPIPMIFCESCKKSLENSKFSKGELENPGWTAVPEKDLPVKLPYVKNFRPTGTDKSPLATVKKFYKVRCPKCKSWARRETDVSDTFLDSAWYYLRYPSVKMQNSKIKMQNENSKSKNIEIPWNSEITKKWTPVNMYIGGAEHSVLHLLYSRFLAMAFKDWGLTHFEEPFTKFRAHGLLIKDGTKMSKSRGNVVNPDEYIRAYGADALRMYLMFLGPFEQGGDFRDDGIRGITRFLERAYKLISNFQNPISKQIPNSKSQIQKILHQTIKKVTEDIENLQYNTAISALMILLNKFEENPSAVTKEHVSIFLRLLAPVAPFITEELWSMFPTNYKLQATSVHKNKWPEYDPKLIQEDTFELVVQINGKVRDKFEAPIDVSEDNATRLTLGRERVKSIVGTLKPRRIIFVPKRLINIVI